jgi:hypothetical protein
MESRGITLAVVMDARDGSAKRALEYVAPDKDTYIEGREGTPFKIVIENRSGRRVAVIPSVDGLSVMDGRKASDASGGYVLEPNGRVEVPGWSRGSEKVARFEFSGLKDGQDATYVALSGGDLEHKGVIGVTVLEERRRRVDPMKGGLAFRSMGLSASQAGRVTLSASSASASSATMRSPSIHEDTSFADDAPEQTLGTAYGEEAEFRTVRSDFVRGEMLTRLALFYDDERGLKRRGIDTKRPIKAKPNPFPGNDAGCPPPPGWSAR